MKKIITKAMALMMAAVVAFTPMNGVTAYASSDTKISAGITQDTATEIKFGTNYVSYHEAGNQEWFSFTTPDKEGYTILSATNISVDRYYNYGYFNVAIYTQYGENLEHVRIWDPGMQGDFSLKLSPNETYFVVASYEHKSGNYRFSVDFKEDTVGDTKEVAKAIKTNKTVISSIDGTDDPDYFSFVGGKYKKYRLVAKNLSIDNKLMYQVTSKYDEVLAYGFATAGQALDLDLPELTKGETYYVKAICYSTGNYQFKIEPVRTSLKDAGAVVSVKSKVKYTGKALKPAVSVKVNNKKLKNGVDYKVTYSNNKKVGKATVTVTGIGNYKGTIKKTFKIVK